MAKKSAVENQKRKERLVKKFAGRRARLKEIVNNDSLSIEERFEASIKLAQMPRNGSATRLRNRCEVTGRPRAFHRKMKMSRIAVRDLGSKGLIPGLVKSSW